MATINCVGSVSALEGKASCHVKKLGYTYIWERRYPGQLQLSGERHPDLSGSQVILEAGVWWGTVFLQDVVILLLSERESHYNSALLCPALRELPSKGIIYLFLFWFPKGKS